MTEKAKNPGLWFSCTMTIRCETCGIEIGKFLVPEFVPIPLELLRDKEYLLKIENPQNKANRILQFFQENPIAISCNKCAESRFDKWSEEMKEENQKFRDRYDINW